MLGAGGCFDTDYIVVTEIVPPENEPPTLILQEPDAFPPVITTRSPHPVVFQLTVADPDGLDDIVAATIRIDSLVVRDAIFRAAGVSVEEPECVEVVYADDDTVDVSRWLIHGAGGSGVHTLYRSTTALGETFGVLLPFPDVRQSADVFGPALVGCQLGAETFWGVGLYPPAVPAVQDIYATLIEIEVRGVSYAVYDSGGHVLTGVYPDFRVRYETAGEAATLP
jgi:hypothetical protein